VKRFLSILALLLASWSGFGQTAAIKGKVQDATGKPIDFATVIIQPSAVYTLTDARGEFLLPRVPAGKTRLQVSFYGMETIDTTVVTSAGKELALSFRMVETSFALENVTVVATRSESGQSTASKISRQAMDHMQTSSLGDLMGLLPGVQITNPSLDQAQAISVRNKAGTNMASLGTAIIVDGAPVSNNANMQFLSSAISGYVKNEATSGYASTGVDVRGLSTDNIESVEVIRGIPSAQYGDMTSGAVLVKSKAGRSPLTLRFKTNPNIYQVSAAKGLRLSPKAGDLNISADYAYNRKELIRDFDTYRRANAKFLWSVMLDGSGRSTANTSLTLTYARDRAELNPDASGRDQRWGDTYGIALNHNGHTSFNKGLLKSVDWLVSGSFNDKVSHIESTASNALNLYSTAMTDGVVYTNTPGQHLLDAGGNEITNAADQMIKGAILPYSYFYTYDIFGKEVNVFAKASATFSKTWNHITDNLLAGIDFKTDGNLGKGAVYDDDFPPFRNIDNASSGYRKRPFYDIPFINQLGVFLEDSFHWQLGERQFNVTAGARYDLVNGLSSLAPRLNASFDIFPWMTLRGGWGITSKAPTSMYLYPNLAYLDNILYNGMSETRPEAERLLVAKTSVYNSENPDLEIARNRKAEIGLDFTLAKRFNISLTYFDELMKNGYTMGLDLPSFIWYRYTPYVVAAEHPGAQPTLTPGSPYQLFFEVYKPYNNIKAVNRGIEFEVDLGRFDAIRTSFYLNGAWSSSSYTNASYAFQTRTNGNNPEHHIGVYNPERRTSHYEDLVTTLRISHNIPRIGFVITLTAQADWFSREWDSFNNPDMFVKYISYKDGKVHDFDPALRTDPEFSYLFETPDPTREMVEKTSAYFLFNLNLSKEISDVMTASFYVNNLLNSRPSDRYEKSGAFHELGIPMFFGFELKINIK